MSPQQNFVVLDIQPIIKGLILASEYYTQSRPISVSRERMEQSDPTQAPQIVMVDETVNLVPITRLTTRRAKMILRALYNETLSQSLRYRTNETATPIVAQALRDCAVPDAEDITMAEEFLCMDEVDQLTIEASKQISNFIGTNPWRQWDLIETETIVALIGGQDYRIAEYERTHGTDDDQGDRPVVSVDLCNLGQYIHSQLTRVVGESIGNTLSPIPLIINAIQRRYPLITFNRSHEKAYDQIVQLLGSHTTAFYNEVFYREHVGPAVDTFQVFFLLTHLDSALPYRAELSAKGILSFYATAQPVDTEERYYRDIRQSIERGDWVPESERRALDDYERNHTL